MKGPFPATRGGTLPSTRGWLFIEGSSLWLDCEIYSETPAGDHTIVLLEVKSLKVSDDRDPLIYHSAAFRSLLPAEPKAA